MPDNITDSDKELKAATLNLKTQTKQLQVVQGILNRTTGFAKSQAEASEKRLTKEIEALKETIQRLTGKSKK